MARVSVWVLLMCFHVLTVSSETPDELLLALKKTYANQPDCTPMFEIRNPGYISPMAVAYPDITTDTECRISCIKDSSCMSYQVDSRNGKTLCRKQPSYSLEGLEGPFLAADVKEYVFTVKCFNSTSKERCVPLIELRLRNWNTHRATFRPSAGSEMECRAICLSDQNCISYQIDMVTNSPQCFIQIQLEMLPKYFMYRKEIVKEYFIVDRCLDKYDISNRADCSPIFKKLYNEVSKRATSYPFVTTEQLCRLHCMVMSDCVSYQIDRHPGAPFCSIQTNMTNLMEDKLANVDPNITEYILVNPCTNKPFDIFAPDCKPFIFPNPYKTVSHRAEEHPEVTSYDGCQSLCLATPACIAFQNDTRTGHCWIVTDWRNLLPDALSVTDLISEIIVSRKCSKGLPNKWSTPLTTKQPVSTTISVATKQPVSTTTSVATKQPVSTTASVATKQPVSTTTTSPPGTPDDCSKHDVVFAICTSGINPGNLESEKRLSSLKSFVSNVTAGLNVASKADQVALVTFESRAYVEFYLSSYTDPTLLAAAIAKVRCHDCSDTEASGATPLKIIQTDVLTTSKGSRPGVSRQIVVITDRWWIDPEPTADIASDLEDAGVFIIPVGVLDDINADDLKKFATITKKEKNQELLLAKDLASLNRLVPKVNKTIQTIAC